MGAGTALISCINHYVSVCVCVSAFTDYYRLKHTVLPKSCFSYTIIVSVCVRPFLFCYLVFVLDNFIQKTKQRYNSPRSLSTKINLADMQTEIKLRPPYQLSPEDLSLINGFSHSTASKYKGIGTDHFTCPCTYQTHHVHFIICNTRVCVKQCV